MRSTTISEQVLQLAREQGMIRPTDLRKRHIPHSYLQQLMDSGDLVRLSRGIYALPDMELTGSYPLAEVCKRVEHGVICLLSALQFHEIGAQAPHEVWIAIDRKAWAPRIDYPPLRVVRFSGAALTIGVERRKAPEGEVRVYNPAKTVVDCFRYRNKIGLDVALEALRESLRARKTTRDEVWDYASRLRISTVIRPYLESLS
ncbi:MAG: type IV toxin-antitoxin system AbiEi family antitoxin domain-containing protein [Actinomycetota bacterium]